MALKYSRLQAHRRKIFVRNLIFGYKSEQRKFQIVNVFLEGLLHQTLKHVRVPRRSRESHFGLKLDKTFTKLNKTVLFL